MIQKNYCKNATHRVQVELLNALESNLEVTIFSYNSNIFPKRVYSTKKMRSSDLQKEKRSFY